MQTSSDEGSRWLLTFLASLFAGGIGFLVKHFLGRGATVIQLGLAQAQTEQIKAQIRREDESEQFAHMRAVAQEARADVVRLRGERDAGDVRVGELLIERRERDERIQHLEEQLKLAEEQLGLKVRSDDGK